MLHNLSGVSIRATSLCTDEQRNFPDDHQNTAFRIAPSTSPLKKSVENTAAMEKELQRWGKFDKSRGIEMVEAAHSRRLKVWTWGDCNNDLTFVDFQRRHFKVDAVIADNIPVDN